MTVGLYISKFPEFQPKVNEAYKQVLKYNNIDYIELHIDDRDFWEKIKSVDLFVFRWAHVDDHHQLIGAILPVIENYLKIKCFPDLNTCWHYDDKIRQFYIFNSLGYPLIESYIFWEKENALKWADRAELPRCI